MSTFYASYPFEGVSSGAGVTSLNGETGAITLVAGSGITITPSGSNITIAATGGGSGTVTSVGLALPISVFTVSGSPVTTSGTLTGTLISQTANTFFAAPNGSSGTPTFRTLVAGDLPSLAYANQALSNLTNPTAINQNLLPGTNATLNLGSTTDVFANIFSETFTVIDGTTTYGSLLFGTTTPSGATANLALATGSNLLNIGIFTASRSTTGNINIETGVASSGNSGNLNFITGTATGTRGSIVFQDGSQGTAGNVWTSTDTTGKGHWASVSSGTVTSVSVVSANGFAGTVATATTTPAITLSTTITGLLQGNGTAISAATTGNLTDAGTDGITVTGGTGAVLGSGTSLSQHVADTTHNGYLSSTDWNTFNGKGSGTVTSVGLALPISVFTVTGSPVTTSGTLTGSFATQAANTVFAGPTTGSAATPTFRALVTADLPAGTGTVTSVAMTVPSFLSISGSPITTSGTLAVTLSGTALPIANGGTGQTTASAAFAALSPLTTAGDIIYENNTPTPARLAIGTTGQVLTVTAGLPSWTTLTTPNLTIGTIDSQTAVANGLQIISDVLYAQSASATQPGMVNTTTQSFAGNKTFTGNTLISQSAASVTTIGISGSTAVNIFNGGMQHTTRTITGNLTVDTTTTDYIIFCNNTGAITVTLPAPTNGRVLILKDIQGTANTNNITIAPHASESIEGVAANYLFQTNWGSITLTSNGTNWFFI